MINFQPNKFAPYIWKTFLTKQIHILHMINFQKNKFSPYIYMENLFHQKQIYMSNNNVMISFSYIKNVILSILFLLYIAVRFEIM